MLVDLSDKELEYIFEYDKTKSITVACDLAKSLANHIIEIEVKELTK